MREARRRSCPCSGGRAMSRMVLESFHDTSGLRMHQHIISNSLEKKACAASRSAYPVSPVALFPSVYSGRPPMLGRRPVGFL